MTAATHRARRALKGPGASAFVLVLVCMIHAMCPGEDRAGGRGSPAATDAKQLADLWDRLGSKDPAEAKAAVGKLISGGDAAAAFLADKFAQGAPDRRRVARLIADLDADDYRTRESASTSLRKAGLAAAPALREALKAGKSPEARARITELLAYCDKSGEDYPEADRYARAIEVLCGIGSVRALRAAKSLAAVAPTEAIRQEADGAVSNIADGLARGLLTAARAKSRAGEAPAALKLSRRALALADDASDLRKKRIQAIVDALAAGRKATDQMWQAAAAPLGPQTPRAVIVAMTKALEAGDGAAFAALFDARGEDKLFLKDLGSAKGKLIAFQAAGIKAYGRQEWKASGGGGMALFGIPTSHEIAGKLQVKIEGNKATWLVEGKGDPPKLVRKGGKWLIEPDKLLPPRARRAQVLRRVKAMADAVGGPLRKIGKAGVTAKQVQREFGHAILLAMKKAAPEPKVEIEVEPIPPHRPAAVAPAPIVPGALAKGKYHLVIQTMRGTTAAELADARKIAKYCSDNGVPAVVVTYTPRGGRRARYMVWSRSPFALFETLGDKARKHAERIEALGRKYFKAHGKYRFKQSRDTKGRVEGWFLKYEVAKRPPPAATRPAKPQTRP